MRIVVLSIEGLQPAFLGAYGNEWIDTPTFDRWAAEGVVFDQHFADVPDLFAARQSWTTGRHSGLAHQTSPDLFSRLTQSGINAQRVGSSPDKARLNMAVTLRRLRTALKKENPSLIWVEIDALIPPWKVSDEYWDKYSQPSAEDDDESKLLEPWSKDLPQSIRPNDHETFARLQATYAAAVSQLDAALAELTSDAAQHGADNAIWMITSPYGLPLGVHGAVGLPSPLHTEFVHLPLMIVWPNSEHAGRRVHALTQSMDLAPTIAELLGIPWQADDSLVSGKSLLPLVESASANIRTHAISTDRRGGYAVRSPNWCLLHHPQQSPQLFVKPDDRWEVNDLAQHNPEVLDALKEVYSKQFNREAT